jgi:hypothetical protein
MTDTDNAPVTQEEIEATTIAGLPALVKKMLKNGSEPDPAAEVPVIVDVPPADPVVP